jgi:hypothetical protein
VPHDLGAALALMLDLDLRHPGAAQRLVELAVFAYLDVKPDQRRKPAAADR